MLELTDPARGDRGSEAGEAARAKIIFRPEVTDRAVRQVSASGVDRAGVGHGLGGVPRYVPGRPSA